MDEVLDARTIPAMVVAACTAYNTSPAVVEEGEVWTYGELGDRTWECLLALMAASVGRGDTVAVWAPNVREWIVAGLAVGCAGARLVPINTRYRGREAADLLSRSGARVLLTVTDFLDTDYVGLLEEPGARDLPDLPDLRRIVLLRGDRRDPLEVGGRSVPVEDWATFLDRSSDVDDHEADARMAEVQPGDVSDVMFTSGTTGRPKGVMVTHEQTLRTFRTWSELVGLRADDRYLIVNPFFHTFGWKAGVLASVMRGATMLPHLVFDAGQVLDRIPADRISMLPGPPALYQSFLQHLDAHPGSVDPSSLRLAVTGAAAIPVSLVERMHTDLGFETVLTAYGLTEATGVVSMCRDGDNAETIATTSGRAIPGTEIRTVDADGNDVGVGEPGEVWFRGSNVMLGYLDDPDATAAAITEDGWLRTGDVGVLDQRGYLDIVDRTKDMFIVGGFNAYPAEIENDLTEHPDIGQVAVVGMPDDRLGEVGCAFVVPRPGRTPDEDEIVTWARERMANFKVPRHVVVVDALPTNASGKVDKNDLRTRATSG